MGCVLAASNFEWLVRVDARSQPRSHGFSSSRPLDPGSLFRSSGGEEERPWKRGWFGQSETIRRDFCLKQHL